VNLGSPRHQICDKYAATHVPLLPMALWSFFRLKFHRRAQNLMPKPEFLRFFNNSYGILSRRNATFCDIFIYLHKPPWNRTITWNVFKFSNFQVKFLNMFVNTTQHGVKKKIENHTPREICFGDILPKFHDDWYKSGRVMCILLKWSARVSYTPFITYRVILLSSQVATEYEMGGWKITTTSRSMDLCLNIIRFSFHSHFWSVDIQNLKNRK